MIEVLKQALDALTINSDRVTEIGTQRKAITSLRQAIAELESQEPVSTLWQHGETGRFRVTTPDSITDCDAQWFKVGDLYTHPPQRTVLKPKEIARHESASVGFYNRGWNDCLFASGIVKQSQRIWVGLTDEEIWQIATDSTIGGDLHADKFAKAIEAKLKERNG